MSNSRRGLLAAGLAAAVVGSMGVVWTLNANAEELPAPEAPAAVAAPADPDPAAIAPEFTTPADVASPADGASPDAAASPDVVASPADAGTADQGGDEPEPPQRLPWGAEPTEIVQAKPGATSKEVAAAGADAAPADTSGSHEPVPEYAPKGRNSRFGALQQATTTVVPPAPPVTGATATAGDVYFHYAVGTQVGDTDGSWANLSIAKPYLASGDFHTLAEIAVQSADGRQIVEVGWTVDRAVNGDSDPHLFVYYWKDRVPTCYNACGFRMYSSTVKPGDTLPVGTSKRFGIQHFDGVWWIAYDSEWIGYFPDSLWNGTYTRAGLTQWFGEVAAATNQPCTDMGNSLPADDISAARIGSISMTNGPLPLAAARATSPYYSVQSLSDRTFRFGGSGAC